MKRTLFDNERSTLTDALATQEEVNLGARMASKAEVSLINVEEEARIRDLIAAETWPQGWSGDEPRGDELIPEVYRDGSVQEWLFAEESELLPLVSG